MRGELKAIGLLSPREHPAGPEEIEHNIWAYSKINWKHSSVQIDELKFVSVRVVPPIIRRNLQISDVTVESIKLPQGRPSRREAIEQAYVNLKGQLDFSLPFSAHVKKIQDEARADLEIEENKGIKDKTIKKYLSSRYQSDKAQLSENSKL